MQPTPSVNNLLFSAANSVINAFGGSALDLDRAMLNRKVRTLYEKAKEHSWNATVELPELAMAPNEEDQEKYGFPEEVRVAFATVISQFYYGERGAQIISAQLLQMVEDEEAAQFLATQVVDEARHVEVMEKMLLHLGLIVPINPFLNALLTDMIGLKRFHEKIIGMNLLVEGLALSMFHVSVDAMKKDERMTPLARARFQRPFELIIRDEARHVGFGQTYLPGKMEKLSKVRLMEIKARQLVWMGLEYASVKYQQAESEKLGVDHMAVVQRVLVEHQERIEATNDEALLDARFIERMLPMVDKVITQVLGGYGRVARNVDVLLGPLYSIAQRVVSNAA